MSDVEATQAQIDEIRQRIESDDETHEDTQFLLQELDRLQDHLDFIEKRLPLIAMKASSRAGRMPRSR